jgi:hypothetical protein
MVSAGDAIRRHDRERLNPTMCPQIASTGKSAKICQAGSKKIFSLLRRANQWFFSARLTRQEGRVAIVTNARWDAVDAEAATDERGRCGRRNRVVLTPRCWRQVVWSYPRGDGDNKAGHRGERAISRKTIAQGRPDALR